MKVSIFAFGLIISLASVLWVGYAALVYEKACIEANGLCPNFNVYSNPFPIVLFFFGLATIVLGLALNEEEPKKR
jgi:hypothetical protein